MQFSITLTETFLKRSYTRRIFRRPWLLGAAVVMIAVPLVSRASDQSWGAWDTVGVTMLAFGALVFGTAWFQHMRMVKHWCAQQGEQPVIYTLSAEGIETTTALGATRLKWAGFGGLSIAEQDTLLHVLPRGALTLPTTQVSPEALRFMTEQLSALGKKVTDTRKRR